MAEAAEDAAKLLGDNWSILSEEEKKVANLLTKLDQTHLFNDWPSAGKDDDAKRGLFQQCIKLNEQYAGGLETYVNNAKQLLADSLAGKNPYAGWTPSVPSGELLEFDSEKFHAMESLALEDLTGLGFVLVAGGLGERLGYSGIKISLPTEITTETCYIDFYIQNILELQRQAREQSKNPDLIFPLAIMTSGDTHDKTVALLEKRDYFGMNPDQLTLMKQEKVPALMDNDAHFARDGSYAVQTKPHGHGDVHSLMFSTGTAKKWRESYGTKWTLFFQDTNAPVFRSYIPALGVAKKYNFAMNTITIPRLAGQAVGGIALLTHEDGRQITINVEYNQLGPLLKSTGDKKGDVANETGFSPYPGNTNSFILDHELYLQILEDSQGAIPEFVNPKYTDDSKTKFKKPTRLECMMQEYPKLVVKFGREVGIMRLPDWMASRPVKNNLVDAKIKYEKVGSAMCASSGEAGIYYLARQYLRAAKVKVEEPGDVVYEGIPVQSGAKVVLSPATGLTLNQVKASFAGGENITISDRSTLVVKGDVTIEKLDLDGGLVLHARPGCKLVVKSLTVKNAGCAFNPIDVNDSAIAEKYRIRGYMLGASDLKVIDTQSTKGEFVVHEE